MELNLAAMLPVSGDEPGLGAVRAEGSLVLPDRLRFTMRLGEADSEVVTTMIAVGSDVYVKDPLGSGWYKDSGGETDVSLVEQLRTLNQPTVAPTELVGLVDLEDGSRGYVLVVVAANDLGGFGGLVGEGTQTFIVDVEDFLTKQFTVEIEHDSIQQENGIQEENDSLVTVKFYEYNLPVDVSPPKDFTTFPTPQAGSPVPLVPRSGLPPPLNVTGLWKTGTGDVEVDFSGIVHVEGVVELQVMDLSGGWTLPLVGGDGTFALIFDATPDGKPSLVAGQSRVAAFVVIGETSQVVDSEGWSVDLRFDSWIYE